MWRSTIRSLLRTYSSRFPSGLIWFLMLANDGASTEGPWGADGAGQARSGPGQGGVSGECGMTDRDTSTDCTATD